MLLVVRKLGGNSAKYFMRQQGSLGKTEGLIQPELQPSPADMMMLINALYFQDKWLIPFAKAYTQADVFHLADGGEKPNVPYMHRLDRDTDYVRGEGFLRADLAREAGWASGMRSLQEPAFPFRDLSSAPIRGKILS